VAPFAIGLVLYVKGPLSVVANTAEFALVKFFHVHLIGLLGHLKGVIMAGAALRSPDIYVLFMTEENRFGSFGLE
jgi:hypothetical protein